MFARDLADLVTASLKPRGEGWEASAGVRVAVSAAVELPLCLRCGQPVSATATTGEPGDQFAAERIECPHCGAALPRDVEKHADRGWRVDEERNG
jgi:DNA-directed RNA polymerase subunit RPC12/RpoP